VRRSGIIAADSRTRNNQAASATRKHSDGATVPTHRYSDVPPAQKLRKLALTAQRRDHRVNRPKLAPSEERAFRIGLIPTLGPAARTLAPAVPRDPVSPRVGHLLAAEDCPALH
jgi:hypothetical protein